MVNLQVIGWLVLSLGAYTIGAVLSKKYAIDASPRLFLMAVMAFTACSAAWMPAIGRINKLALLGMVWSIGYVVIDCFVGIGFFDERLTALQTAGMILGMISIVLMSL